MIDPQVCSAEREMPSVPPLILLRGWVQDEVDSNLTGHLTNSPPMQ